MLDLGAPEVSSKTQVSVIGYDGDVDVSRFQNLIKCVCSIHSSSLIQ